MIRLRTPEERRERLTERAIRDLAQAKAMIHDVALYLSKEVSAQDLAPEDLLLKSYGCIDEAHDALHAAIEALGGLPRSGNAEGD